MFKNYFFTAINNLIKNKLYSAINIIGLAIGLAACIVMGLYVQDESSYDKQWGNTDSLYRMHFTFAIPGAEPIKFPVAPLPAKSALETTFPEEIERLTRAFNVDRVVKIGSAEFEEGLVNVDGDFDEMFGFEIVSGSIQATLEDPSNIALREDVAARFFGANPAVGEVITVQTLDVSRDYQVSAVYSVPGNTVLDIPMFSLLDETSLPASLFTWFSVNVATYIQLKPGVNISTLEAGLPAMIDQYVDFSQIFPDSSVPSSEIVLTGFQNVIELHLDSPWDTSRVGGNKTVVLAFSIISALVLIIGGINFTILTTAKATQRAREVAMRKVLGANRKQLITQFLGESFFIVLLAIALSLAVVELMLPVFESMVGKELYLDYTTPSTFIYLLALMLLVGVCGGLYPAFILSNFRPSSILKSNKSAETKGSSLLRNVLVIFQFTVSIILIIATSVVFLQLQYSTNRDPGFNKDNLVVINTLGGRPELQERAETLKQELLSLASVSAVGFSSTQPSQQQQGYNVYVPLGQSNNYTIARTQVGYDYFQTYEIPLAAGRYYDIERDLGDAPDDINSDRNYNTVKELLERNIIVNESGIRAMGFSSPEDAIGKIIVSTAAVETQYTIIGVINDNHIFSINALPRAEMYHLETAQPGIVTIRFQGSPQSITERIETIWRDVMGDVSLSTVFVDQLLLEEFEQEQTEARMLISFSFLAILIACLGLYGSASFTVDRRTKEIGLRKVMGAKIRNIVTLLIWQFSKPVLIANVIAWPIAIWAMTVWLERFPYQFNAWIFLPLCLAAGFIALSVATLTVASNTARVASSNPIKALRYE